MNKLIHLSKELFTPGRSLLLPMSILALGLHAALLALPLPSTEAQKEAEDKKNPITINQIPTEKPTTEAGEASPAASVTIPPLSTATASASTSGDTTSSDTSSSSPNHSSGVSDTSTSTQLSSTTSSTVGNSSPSASSSATESKSTGSESTAKKSDSAANASAGNDDLTSTESLKAESNSEAAESADGSSTRTSEATPAESIATAAIAPSTIPANASTDGAVTNPFADFPHYEPSQKDCYGLGYGENCRTVQNVEIAQIVDFFQKQLAAKEFTASLVADEPTHKVLKVSRNNKTLFLNIWQGKQISYLLSDVVYKQAPEEIKTEAPR